MHQVSSHVIHNAKYREHISRYLIEDRAYEWSMTLTHSWFACCIQLPFQFRGMQARSICRRSSVSLYHCSVSPVSRCTRADSLLHTLSGI